MQANTTPAKNSGWDITTRVLHWLLVITVTFQLLSSLIMASQATKFLFPFHEIVGLAAGLCVITFWLYTYAYQGFGTLFPWHREGREVVAGELRGLIQGRLPQAGNQPGLSGFIHGLGMLALTGSAASGYMIFTLTPLGSGPNPADAVAFTNMSLFHKFMGELFWIYIIGHISFALLHQLNGTNILAGIFGFKETATATSKKKIESADSYQKGAESIGFKV